jgi:restriction endonuclease S subunit
MLHLTIKKNKVLPEYLTLVLNSLVVQMQSQRDAGGSIIKHWKPSEIGEILIPIISPLIQTQIEEKIKTSFKLKEKSKQLLEVAKRAVEIAIEDGENKAMEYINE